MLMLIAGLALWVGVHLIPTLGRGFRTATIDRIGLQPWKGLFSLALIGALVLIVFGWQSSSPAALYQPPQGLRMVTVLLMWPALILFVSGRLPADYKRIIRHPQLLSIKVWALAHLLSNGEVRSLILFGTLLLWAVAMMVLINRRDGPRELPQKVGIVRTLIPVIVGTVLFALLMHFHASFTGMPVIGTL